MPLRFVENPDWPNNNILASLMYAAGEMDGGFFFSYSDIVFAPDVARKLAAAAAASDASAALIVDRRWDDAYVGRTLHPIPEAELARVDDRQRRRGRHPRGQAGGAARAGGRRVHRPGLVLRRRAARALREVWQQAVATAGWRRRSAGPRPCATPT